ncbi:MAG: sulfatase-like hydrolase/transferase [Sphingomonadaceae bacterium]
MTRLSQMARYLKPVLLVLALAFALPGMVGNAFKFAEISGTISYAFQFALVWAAFLIAGFIPNAPLRWLTAIVLAAASYFLLVYEHTTGRFMSYDAFINMLNAAGFIGEALVQNRAAFIGAVPASLLLLFAIGLRPRQQLKLSGWLVPVIPLIGLAAVTGHIYLRGGEGGDDQPPGFVTLAYLGLAGYEATTGNIGERQPVQLATASEPKARNIVLMVDESIAADYLDINAPGGVPTPLSREWPGVAIHNYGRAASITNCSAGSNASLRFGGTRANYLQTIATAPSIWAFAKKAGLRTVYIDAQHDGGTLQNMMTAEEKAEIDRFVQYDDVPKIDRDMAAARTLREELADPSPKFILVNKAGAHFPIQDIYPEEYMHYRPALPRSKEGEQYFAGMLRGFKGSPQEWALYRNSYRNTLVWRVSAFFEEFLGKADLADTTIIYTADHGQDLHEDGSSGLYTHCGPDAVPVEGAVPMLVIEGADRPTLDWEQHLASNHDRTSHYMIFPTLLALMGYDRAAAAPVYGAPLDAPSTDPGTFNKVFNARLNRQPEWVSIAPANRPMQAMNEGNAKPLAN